MQKFKVDSDSKQRLDIFVLSKMPELNRSTIQSLIKSEHILVNNNAEKTGFMVRNGDIVTVGYNKKIEDIDLPILYEDDDCIVIDKPVGVLTHSKGALNPEGTVATFIAPKLRGLSGERAGIVHRLDRATSGVIICAKNEPALSKLQKQFSQRKTKKSYMAVIKHGLEPKEAIIDMPIERDPKNMKQFRVGANGKSAQTHYKIAKTNGTYDLVELKPVTGRTHQIRVHLKQLGYPIVGDVLYGGQHYDRLMLHAKNLEITLPNSERKTFESKIPKEFTAIMK